MKNLTRVAMLALSIGVATPALAFGPIGMSGGHGPLAGLSPEGKAAVKAAMQAVRSDGTQEQIQAVRAKELDLADTPVLDVVALGRAMHEERALVAGQQQRRQAAMLSAYQQLSPADRHTLVANTRALQARVMAMREAHRGEQVAGGR